MDLREVEPMEETQVEGQASEPEKQAGEQAKPREQAAPPEPSLPASEAAFDGAAPAIAPDGENPAELGADADAGAEAHSDAGERTLAELEREVAVLLFASPEPLSAGRLVELLRVRAGQVHEAIAALGQRFLASGLPYEVREIAGGWQIFTSAEMAETVALLARVRKEEKVSPAALETLAVVAYRQPVTKAEIEAIRGVQVGPILRALAERGLVKVTGRSDQPGHPLLYGTTRKFLDSFGLAGLDALPRDGELLRD